MRALTPDEFARLPVGDDQWLAALVRMPAWIDDEKSGESFRPHVGVLLARSGMLHVTPPLTPEEVSPEQVVQLMLEFAAMPGHGARPEVLIVNRPDLEEAVRGALGKSVPEIVVDPSTPMLNALMEDMAAKLGGGHVPGLLSGKGVTVERVRSFAEAADAFHRAAPWVHLNDADLIKIETEPKPPKGAPKYAVVIGSGGETFGVGFYNTVARYEQTMTGDDPLVAGRSSEKLYSVVFNGPDEVPFGDHDLWAEHGLPLAAPDAYPFPVFYHGATRVTRPDAALLAYTEGVLRAIAASTEEEMDRGQWTKEVGTADGPRKVTLSLPELQKAVAAAAAGAGARGATRSPAAMRLSMERAMADMRRRIDESGLTDIDEINAMLAGQAGQSLDDVRAETPAERARELVERSYAAQGRREVQLLREALAIDPDCADAYARLADRYGDPARRLELYRQAVAAADRALRKQLGEDYLREHAGHFWGMLETRPYMRARLGVAAALSDAGDHAAAVAEMRELLRLNPNDNQGVRDLLYDELLEMGDNRGVLELAKRYPDDLALPEYAKALALFRLEGDSGAARRQRDAALRANSHVPKMLTAPSEYGGPEVPDTYSPGKPSEAAYVAAELGDAWRGTRGAVRWLVGVLPGRRPPAPRRRRRG